MSADATTNLERRVAEKPPDAIARMFDAIARRYDLLNHLLSGGADLYWRWRAIRGLGLTGRETLLDVCTGTCDVAIEALRRGGVARAVGLDFAGEMLRHGREKLRRRGYAGQVGLVRGDAVRLPLCDRSIDVMTIAFGIRNVQSPAAACQEMARVLKPGGRLAVLEFSTPSLPVVRQVYLWYFKHVLPRIGRLVSSHSDAYTYLPTSVGSFLTPASFTNVLTAAGFREIRSTPLTLGVVYLYVATKA
jgi:demethylmenaquinone methyltransferase/2-methoxy-6-polyprenyl-1,4-benzoquinol methylase